MLRMLVSLALLLVSAATTANSASPALTLSFPMEHQAQRFAYFDPKHHFHVLLTNTSDRPQRVWEDWNSWGHYSLSFEMTDASGKSWHVVRPEVGFTKNYASYWTIAPGDTLVMDVYFADPQLWRGFPIKKGQENSVHMRAVFEVAPSPESAQFEVWTGRIESKTMSATFVR